MTSIRGRLLAATWAAVLIIGGLCAAVTYGVAKRETEHLLDGEMQRVAHIVSERRGGEDDISDPASALPPGYETEDDVFVEIRDAAGNLVYRSRNDVQLPAIEAAGFGNVNVGREHYKVFVARAGDHRVTVAQSTEVRQESAAGAALAALVPVALIIPTLGIVIMLVVRRQLRPIARTANAIAQRPPFALDALPTESLPAEIRPLVAEINELLGRLQVAVAREHRFLADAAHALRTPLAALQLQADVMDGSEDPEERARRLSELRAGIRRIVRLSTQLLALARHESEDRESSGHLAVSEAFSDIQAVYGAIAGEKGIALTPSAAPDVVIRGNPQQLILILGNLLDNALRYTKPGGKVELHGRVDGDTVHFEVRDEGAGLPEEELQRVFERFYRAPGDATEGSGLGLATVATVVENMGGRAWLENRKDRPGLIAHVTIPRTRPSPNGPGTAA